MSQTGWPRLDPRARLRLRIDVTPGWKDGACISMETIDLSVSGAACRSPINLPLKTQVSVALWLPAIRGQPARDLRCEAVVVNVERIGRGREEWRAGLYFLDLQANDQEALRRFVFKALEACGDHSARRPGGGQESRS